MMQFLDKKEPVVDIKEQLYARVQALKAVVKTNAKIIPFDEREGAMLEGETSMANSEIEFLTNLLDMIERS